jgi:hypothetical protein
MIIKRNGDHFIRKEVIHFIDKKNERLVIPTAINFILLIPNII